jgi:hypothetical protein
MLSTSSGRGFQMNAVRMPEVVAFAKQWIAAGPHVVQHWQLWEAKASQAFGIDAVHDELMHGVMSIVCCVCLGGLTAVKQGVRGASPSELATTKLLFGHLQEFSVLLEAETRFRACQLVADWVLELHPRGKVVVRSELRSSTGGTEH